MIYFLPGRGSSFQGRLGVQLQSRGYELTGRVLEGEFAKLPFPDQINLIADDLAKYSKQQISLIAHSFGAYLGLHAILQNRGYAGNVFLISPILGSVKGNGRMFKPPQSKRMSQNLAPDFLNAFSRFFALAEPVFESDLGMSYSVMYWPRVSIGMTEPVDSRHLFRWIRRASSMERAGKCPMLLSEPLMREHQVFRFRITRSSRDLFFGSLRIRTCSPTSSLILLSAFSVNAITRALPSRVDLKFNPNLTR